jgi:hypothetical protein
VLAALPGRRLAIAAELAIGRVGTVYGETGSGIANDPEALGAAAPTFGVGCIGAVTPGERGAAGATMRDVLGGLGARAAPACGGRAAAGVQPAPPPVREAPITGASRRTPCR